jgi:hypothetical protein
MLFPRYVYLGASSNRPQFYFSPAPKKETLYKFACKSAKDSLFRTLDTLRNEVEWEWTEKKADTLDPAVAKTTINSRTSTAFPTDTVFIAYNKPLKDSLKQSFYVVINKDTSKVTVMQTDPIRFVVQNASPWPTDAKVKVLMGYMDTTLARADSNGVRDTVIEEKYKQLLQFETVPKLKLASLKGKIPGAHQGAYVRLKPVDRTSYFYAPCGSDGSFAFDELVEGNYFVDYYYPEKGRREPDAGGLEPFRYGSAWRSPNDTVKIANGVNELEKLVPNLPALK